MMEEIHGPKGVTDGEIQLETRKGWREWAEILDAWDANDKCFSPTLRYLTIHHGLNYYWAQLVAVYYVRQHSRTGDLSHFDF